MTAPTSGRTLVDAEGTEVHIGPYDPGYRASLGDLYGDYPPEHRSLGLPPVLDAKLEQWLSLVLDIGTNFVAVVDGEVVGHAVYAPTDAEEADFVVFVDPDYHGRGIGTALLRDALRHASRAGVDRVVSHAEADNERALHVYDKVGFDRLEEDGLVVKVGIELDGYDGIRRENA